ncbi:hypothetical protein [Leifsonia xyli]|uniref:hypothetical protein n=1 Tax=Leifsonia xyli TaxID=1575 RepID=UPI003D6779E5
MAQPGDDSWMLRCVLVAADGTETVIDVPALVDAPPVRVRVPAPWEGAAALDVYGFSHLRGSPPEAVYTYLTTEPRTTDDLSGGPGEVGPSLPG